MSRQVDEWPVEHVIVVSHSIGGLIGLEVTGNMPDRVVGFVCSVLWSKAKEEHIFVFKEREPRTGVTERFNCTIFVDCVREAGTWNFMR